MSSTIRRMHVSLDVRDLDRSVAFYRRLFDREPVKRHGDYAKFQLDDPGLVLSLNPAAPAHDETRLSHLGIQLRPGELERVADRLQAAGQPLRVEDGVTCCYAVQNKRWAIDPDGNAWELYELLRDTDVHSEPAEGAATCCAFVSGDCG